MARKLKGRGTWQNPAGRFERLRLEPEPGEAPADGNGPAVPTRFFRDTSRSLIVSNDSPDVSFDFSINPYRGCEHGCIYCYARPYHEYLGLSAGLDFETMIFVKDRAAEILRAELGRPSWRGEPLGMCGVTDAYQPVERRLGVTRRCLEVLAECRQPVGIFTKSALVARDADLLAELARHGAAHVWLTITTLDEALRRVSEPRAATADARFDAVARLVEHGIPAGVMVSPVIPGLTDHEIPALVERASRAGASFVSYSMLRLPRGVRALFEQWMAEHRPGEAAKVLGRLAQVRGGRACDGGFEARMSGEGPLAEVVGRLFEGARRRAGLAGGPPPLSSSAFRRPGRACPLFEAGPRAGPSGILVDG